MIKAQDIAAAEELWNALQDKFSNLTPGNVTRIFMQHGFSINSGSGSRHYNMQPPEAISGLGSFTMTPFLSKYLLKKMLEKNFDKFFERFTEQERLSLQPQAKTVSKATSSTPTKQADVEHTEAKKNASQIIIARAYRQFAQKKKKYTLYKQIIALDKAPDLHQLKLSISTLESQLREYPDLLPILYIKSLDLFESIEESAATLQKLLDLSMTQVIQNMENSSEIISYIIYHHYAEHLEKFNQGLQKKESAPKEYFQLMQSCITLHLHVLSMLSPPFELCKLQYPIPLLKNIDDKWRFYITANGQAFITCAAKLFEEIFDKAQKSEGTYYQLAHKTTHAASSASSSASSAASSLASQFKNQSLSLMQQTSEVFKIQAPARVEHIQTFDFDWHIFAYFLSQMRISQNDQLLKHTPDRHSKEQEIYFLESAIELLNYSITGSHEHIIKISPIEDIKNEVFYVSLALIDTLIKHNNIDKACRTFTQTLRSPAVYTGGDTEEFKKMILGELVGKINLLTAHLLDNFEKNDNLHSFFEMNKLFLLHYKISVCPKMETIRKIIRMLQTAANNIKYLSLKLNAKDLEALNAFLLESEKFMTAKNKNTNSLITKILPIISNFDAVLNQKGWKPDALQKQALAKWQDITKTLSSSSSSSSKTRSFKN